MISIDNSHDERALFSLTCQLTGTYLDELNKRIIVFGFTTIVTMLLIGAFINLNSVSAPSTDFLASYAFVDEASLDMTGANPTTNFGQPPFFIKVAEPVAVLHCSHEDPQCSVPQPEDGPWYC